MTAGHTNIGRRNLRNPQYLPYGQNHYNSVIYLEDTALSENASGETSESEDGNSEHIRNNKRRRGDRWQ